MQREWTRRNIAMATKKRDIKFKVREGKINFMGSKMTEAIYLAQHNSRMAVLSSALGI